MRDKNDLVCGNERVDGEERHFEEPEGQGGTGFLETPKLGQMGHEIFEEDADHLVRDGLVRDEHLKDGEDMHVGDGVLDEEVHMTGPDL